MWRLRNKAATLLTVSGTVSVGDGEVMLWLQSSAGDEVAGFGILVTKAVLVASLSSVCGCRVGL